MDFVLKGMDTDFKENRFKEENCTFPELVEAIDWNETDLEMSAVEKTWEVSQ